MKIGDSTANAERTGRVIAECQTPFPDPLVVGAGEELTITERDSEWGGWVWCTNREGKSGWVPESFVRRKDSTCVALRDYDATELTVSVGDIVTISDEESGWFWCTDARGQSGWVPADRVEID